MYNEIEWDKHRTKAAKERQDQFTITNLQIFNELTRINNRIFTLEARLEAINSHTQIILEEIKKYEK